MKFRVFAFFIVILALSTGGIANAVEPLPETSDLIKQLRTKAENGDALAQANLAVLLDALQEKDLDILADGDVEAVKWYRLAAEYGFANMQSHLGYHYQKGEGVPADLEEAIKWYELAAEQGFREAMYLLAKIYIGDVTGQPIDETQGLKWMNLYVAMNLRNRGGKLESLRAKIPGMTEEQITEVEQLVFGWLDSHLNVKPKIVEFLPGVIKQLEAEAEAYKQE